MRANRIKKSPNTVGRLSVATTILTLGMMSSLAIGVLLGGTAIAATANDQNSQNNHDQQQQQTVNESYLGNSVSADIPKEENEGSSSGSVSTGTSGGTVSITSSGTGVEGANAADSIQAGGSFVVTDEEQVVVAPNSTVAPEEKELTYPSFTEEEMNQLFNVGNPTPGTPTQPAPEEGEGSGELEYLEETAQIYRHVPVNPVYTYGKDEEGKGKCAGTEEFCQKSEELWKNFEEKVANNEPITHTEGENKGQLIMPEPYNKNVENQPAVKSGECPEGFEPYPSGNPGMGVTEPHCGNLEGSTYRVAPLK